LGDSKIDVKTMMNAPFIIRLGATLIVLLLIVAGSAVPGQARPGDSAFVWLVAAIPSPVQKVLHIVTYAALAMLLMWTLERVPSMPTRVATALAITIATGVGLEWYQTTVPGRYGTLTDIILNIGGAVSGVILALVFL
jgi:VanZ family protein